ncbi:uncharacterized protein [Amphiura filiformis]|uniref:uncharacterized protein n=1 Tax=Amphiura filiformis TaxID=82378 RepID=UPI003B20FBAF
MHLPACNVAEFKRPIPLHVFQSEYYQVYYADGVSLLLLTVMARSKLSCHDVQASKKFNKDHRIQPTHIVTTEQMSNCPDVTGDDRDEDFCNTRPSTSCAEKDVDFDLINIVKEDLKQSIHRKRHQKGLCEILNGEDFPRTYQLTAVEQRKQQLRKERNRIAAAKCRDKKQQETIRLMQESEKLTLENRALEEQALNLRAEKMHLQQLLEDHLVVCPMVQQA